MTIRICSRDEPWFADSCRIAFDRKRTSYYAWRRLRSAANWDNYTHLQREANQCYERARRSYNESKKEIFQNATNQHTWWLTLRVCIGSQSSIPPLLRPGGGVAFGPADKAELFSTHFPDKQPRDQIICLPRVTMNLVCFLVVGGLEASPGSWPLWWMWPIRILSSIPAQDRSNSGPEIKCGSSFPGSSWWVSRMLAQSRCNSCTTLLFVYWVQAHLNNSSMVESYVLQALQDGGELCLLQVDFSAAIDCVNHAGLLHKLRSVGVGGSVLNIIDHFLANRTQRVVIDGVASSSVPVISGVCPSGPCAGTSAVSVIYPWAIWDCREHLGHTWWRFYSAGNCSFTCWESEHRWIAESGSYPH